MEELNDDAGFEPAQTMESRYSTIISSMNARSQKLDGKKKKAKRILCQNKRIAVNQPTNATTVSNKVQLSALEPFEVISQRFSNFADS